MTSLNWFELICGKIASVMTYPTTTIINHTITEKYYLTDFVGRPCQNL